MPRSEDTHDCPGGCGRAVPHRLLACGPCWYELPVSLRRAVIDTYRRDRRAHADAVVRACAWYRARAERGEQP
jgi:hypothetical protein